MEIAQMIDMYWPLALIIVVVGGYWIFKKVRAKKATKKIPEPPKPDQAAAFPDFSRNGAADTDWDSVVNKVEDGMATIRSNNRELELRTEKEIQNLKNELEKVIHTRNRIYSFGGELKSLWMKYDERAEMLRRSVTGLSKLSPAPRVEERKPLSKVSFSQPKN